MVLLEDWATFSKDVPGIFGISKNRFESVMALYQAAWQIIYGGRAPFAFADNHCDTAINQLRMAIEIRLRRGFGILAKTNKRGEIVPLALSNLIEAIVRYKSSITFAVPFEHISRLYGWANVYSHGALKQYAWSPIFALQYLRPFLIGGIYNDGVGTGASVDAGIMTDCETVQRVQNDVKEMLGSADFNLVTLDPEQCDLVLKPR
jgi:hypothetical protein